jgi:hypothetical protein
MIQASEIPLEMPKGGKFASFQSEPRQAEEKSLMKHNQPTGRGTSTTTYQLTFQTHFTASIFRMMVERKLLLTIPHHIVYETSNHNI